MVSSCVNQIRIGELEKELNLIREQIMTLQQKMEQQELEKPYFQLIKRFLLLFQFYLCFITSYQTFKTEYNELEISIEKPNTIQLLMILFRALPYIMTKRTCFKAMRRSSVFIIAFIFLVQKTEKYRNIGFIISSSYSCFCAWNFNRYQYFYHYLWNVALNALHLANRYIMLHGLTDFFGVSGL